MTQYALTVQNNSDLVKNFCICLRDPRQQIDPNLFTLAWIVTPVHPGAKHSIRWETEYSLVWGESGTLTPGKVFHFGQEKLLDLSVPAKTASAFSAKGRGYQMVQTNYTVPAGKIGILADSSIPETGVTLGIGVSGKPAFAMTASPNDVVIFQPQPEYRLAFGNFREGEVLDAELLGQSCEIPFDRERHAAISLEQDQQWNIQN